MHTSEQKEEIFYVGVKDPIELRRSLLESSKDMIQVLQRFERFKEVRKEKIEAMLEIKKVMGEVKRLFSQLKSTLPETELRVELGKEKNKVEAKNISKMKTKEETKAKIAKAEKKERLSVKEMSDLDKLEAELSAIEQKLGGLA